MVRPPVKSKTSDNVQDGPRAGISTRPGNRAGGGTARVWRAQGWLSSTANWPSYPKTTRSRCSSEST